MNFHVIWRFTYATASATPREVGECMLLSAENVNLVVPCYCTTHSSIFRELGINAFQLTSHARIDHTKLSVEFNASREIIKDYVEK